jgi:hypothetical protein
MKKVFGITSFFCMMFMSSVSFANPIHISKEAKSLSKKISKLKDKYHLEFKSEEDLDETCELICRYSKYSRFSKYDVATIVLKESRFNPKAVNKVDKGLGLGQLTKIKEWHKETLFWVKNPLDKSENIRAMLVVLEDNYRSCKSKTTAIRHYNGFKEKSYTYLKDFQHKKNILLSV